MMDQKGKISINAALQQIFSQRAKNSKESKPKQSVDQRIFEQLSQNSGSNSDKKEFR